MDKLAVLALKVDLYELLGIGEDAAQEDIRRAWRRRALNVHPDKKGVGSFKPSDWEDLQQAYDILSEPTIREQYDAARHARIQREKSRHARREEDKGFDAMADRLAKKEQDFLQSEQLKQSERRAQMQRFREQLDKEESLARSKRQQAESEKLRQEEAAQEARDLKEAKRRLEMRKTLRAMARQSGLKTSSAPAVIVPGNHMVQVGEVKKSYWELGMDKLRAMQKVKNARKQGASQDVLQQAERGLREVQQCILDAQKSYLQTTGGS